MPTVTITKQCHDLIRANAELAFRNTSTRLPSGNFSIPLSQDVYDRVIKYKLDGESISDSLIRILSTQKGKN